MTILHFKIILRKDFLKKNGQYPVCLRINAGSIPKLFPLGFDVYEKDFDQGKPRVKKTDPFHHQKNQLILKAETKAGKIAFDYAMNDKNLPLDEFTKAYKNDNYGSVSFYAYIKDLIVKRDSELSPDTIRYYEAQLSKLEKFRPSLTFGELNEDFIISYRDYMKEKDNQEITWNKSLEFVKRICNRAFKESKIITSPFKNLEIKRMKGTYEHLTVEELISLDKKFQEQTLPANLQNVLRYFLFACYTAMRYRDVLDLRFVNVKNKGNETDVDFVQHKTKKHSVVPLIPQAIGLIPAKEFEEQRVFKVNTDQDTNRKLKVIMGLAGINKRITFHSARHTCSNALYLLEVPLDVRCQILGDTKEVVSGHYTSADRDITFKALNKLSLAMNAKMLKRTFRKRNR